MPRLAELRADCEVRAGEYLDRLRDAINQAMEEQGADVEALALLAGTAPNTIRNFLKGETDSSGMIIAKVIAALDLEIDATWKPAARAAEDPEAYQQ